MLIYIAIGFIAFSFVGLGGLILYYRSVKKKYASNVKLYQKDQIEIKSKTGISDVLDVVYQRFYLIAVKIPVISYYTRKTRIKLEMVNDYSEYEIRKKTASILIVSLFFLFSGLFVLLNVIDDLYSALIAVLGIFLANDMLVNSKVNKIADRITRQIPEVFTSIRHSFHEHGMVEESLNDAIDELEDKEITPQIKRIKEAILHNDPETQLEKYYDTSPNRFLKLFAGLSHLTRELGDRKIEGMSIYLKNLNNILNDVYLEILKRDKIDYMFKSLTWISIVPLLAIQAIETWSIKNFPALINFYNSGFGFVVKVLFLIGVFVAYFGLKVLKDDSNQIKFDKMLSKRWQEKLYNKFKIVKTLADGLMPRPHTRKYRKKTMEIKATNSYLTLEWLYVNKMSYAFVAFVAMIVLLLNVKYLNVQAVYKNISDEFLQMGQLSETDQKAAEAITKTDTEIVKEIKDDKNTSNEEIKAYYKEITGKDATDDDVTRIKGKIKTVKTTYLKAWEYLVALFIAWGAYFIPDLTIKIKNKIRAMEKEDEVMQFQSIILMLMYIERIDVETILEWLERYSYAFKEPITTCLNNYEAGSVEALEDLRDAVPNKDFQRMVDGLVSSVERIPVKDAFDELETERSFYYERRKSTNEKIINQKVTYGKAIGFMPMVLLIGGYFVGPMMVVSVLQLINYFKTMGGMG